jgi:hypothetical protein
MKKIFILFLTLLSVGLVGCGELPITLEMVDPEEVRVGTQTLDIRNCDSNDDMLTTMASQSPVSQKIKIAEQATLEKNGSSIDIPSYKLEELKSQVAVMYQAKFEQAVTDAEQVTFTIPANKIHMYKIHRIQQNYRSTISFSIDRQPCTTSYEYTLETSELDSLTTMSCTA